jgi:hypothetical protein
MAVAGGEGKFPNSNAPVRMAVAHALIRSIALTHPLASGSGHVSEPSTTGTYTDVSEACGAKCSTAGTTSDGSHTYEYDMR